MKIFILVGKAHNNPHSFVLLWWSVKTRSCSAMLNPGHFEGILNMNSWIVIHIVILPLGQSCFSEIPIWHMCVCIQLCPDFIGPASLYVEVIMHWGQIWIIWANHVVPSSPGSETHTCHPTHSLTWVVAVNMFCPMEFIAASSCKNDFICKRHFFF